MSTPQANTKIERVIEGFESLTLAIAAGVKAELSGDAARRQFEIVQSAREECREALHEFMKPTLRVLGD